jgi:CutA1 divalent ion tolerance protein
VRSAHNFTPVRSIYRWQGEIHERTEGRVSLHTSRNRVPEIIERAKQEHPLRGTGRIHEANRRRKPRLPGMDRPGDRVGQVTAR